MPPAAAAPVHTHTLPTNPYRLTARAVLLDMEPKVVAAAQRAGGGAWHYSKAASLTRQPGSGNNWAQGALRHAPAVSQQVLGMLRRQAERCDSLSGFLVLQVRQARTAAAADQDRAMLLQLPIGPPSCT